jgi:pyridoxamine 5'-phosphate oxidase-like protein
MTTSLPEELLEVFERSATADYVTIDGRGQPIVWPVAPSYRTGEMCIDVAHEPGQAADSGANPHVALLFCDTAGLEAPPMVLVQGTARVDADTIHVRPERIYVWPQADLEAEPELYDAHLDEVRAAHNEEPEVGHATPEGGQVTWDERLDALGAVHPEAVLAFVGPDGFPFAVRVPVQGEREVGIVRIEADPVGAPIEPGLACLCAPDEWFRVLGDLDEDRGRWVLRPHRVASAAEQAG